MRAVQETIFDALDRPSVPRVFVHTAGDCWGYVLFDLTGGRCQHCGQHVPDGQYAKPGTAASEVAA